MTITEALGRVDTLKPNRYTRSDKLCWLAEVDAAAARVLGLPAPVYGADDQAVLLLPTPFDSAYLRYMEAQIDYHDGARAGYETAMARYEKVFAAFRADRQRTHVPQRGGVFL